VGGKLDREAHLWRASIGGNAKFKVICYRLQVYYDCGGSLTLGELKKGIAMDGVSTARED
jgi:hypothetical protein